MAASSTTRASSPGDPGRTAGTGPAPPSLPSGVTRTPEQGAAIAVRLATLPDDGPRGGFFDDEGVVPW
ncbi:hypothetical protein [Streptomyces canus]|uniref:hypothetical protein n=1 Tax=Streptomyces canus TaxID=58343 RepID=UPI003F6C3F7F